MGQGPSSTGGEGDEGEVVSQTRSAFFKVLFLCGLSILTMGSLQLFKATDHHDPTRLLQNAEAMLAEGDFPSTVSTLNRLLSILPESEARLRCRIHFLLGETLQRVESGESATMDPLSDSGFHYGEASRLDPTPWGAFSVPALLALAKADPSSPEIQEQIAAAIADPNDSSHPLVREGVLHRILAEAVWTEQPERAVSLLETARDLRGDLADGAEELLIASILRIALDDPDRAIACYESILRNGVASRENREIAASEKESLQSTHIQSLEPSPSVLPEVGAN